MKSINEIITQALASAVGAGDGWDAMPSQMHFQQAEAA
jgi:hypothetical protein